MDNLMYPQLEAEMKSSLYEEEVSSKEWEPVFLTHQEQDLVHRMHKLVGDRWELIAGRIPGRKAEELERFWLMKNRMLNVWPLAEE